MITRRQLLTTASVSVSAAIGGCLNTIRSGGEPTSAETEIIEVGEVSDVPVSFSVTQATTELSSEELPAFSVTIENEDDTTLWFHNARPRVFSPGPSTPRAFHILSRSEAESIEDGTSEVAPAEPTDCLWIEHPPARPADEPQILLEPGEPESQEFAYAPDENVSSEGCPEPGEYAFQEEYRFYTEGQDERDEPEYLDQWGFTVRVHED